MLFITRSSLLQQPWCLVSSHLISYLALFSPFPVSSLPFPSPLSPLLLLYEFIRHFPDLDTVLEVKGNGDELVEYVSFQQIVYEVNEWHCPPIPKACDGQGADYLNTSAIYVRYPLLTTLISFPSFSIFLHTSPLCHLFPYHPIALSHPLRLLFFLLSMLPSLPLPHSLTHPLPLPLLPLPVLFIVFIYFLVVMQLQ